MTTITHGADENPMEKFLEIVPDVPDVPDNIVDLVPDRTVHERLDAIENILESILQLAQAAHQLSSVVHEKAVPVLEEAIPIIKELSEHPMLKMFGVGKKKTK